MSVQHLIKMLDGTREPKSILLLAKKINKRRRVGAILHRVVVTSKLTGTVFALLMFHLKNYERRTGSSFWFLARVSHLP